MCGVRRPCRWWFIVLRGSAGCGDNSRIRGRTGLAVVPDAGLARSLRRKLRLGGAIAGTQFETQHGRCSRPDSCNSVSTQAQRPRSRQELFSTCDRAARRSGAGIGGEELCREPPDCCPKAPRRCSTGSRSFGAAQPDAAARSPSGRRSCSVHDQILGIIHGDREIIQTGAAQCRLETIVIK